MVASTGDEAPKNQEGILTIIPDRGCDYPHFPDKETEAFQYDSPVCLLCNNIVSWDCGISLRNMPLECMGKEGKCMWSCSVVSDSLRPHGLQSIRLLHPWDFPGKSARVDCHFLLQKKESKSKIRNGSGSVYEKDTQERYNLVPKIVQLKDLGVWFHSFLSTHSTILLRLIETDPDTLLSEPPGKSKK